MRKFFLIVFLCLFTKTWAETVEIDGVTYYLYTSSKTAEVESCDNEIQGNVEIQASVVNRGTTYTVTSIRFYAFEHCTGLTEIKIPNTVTSIESGAFRDCTGLTEITIPNSVTGIGNGVFFGCIGLTEIKIPNTVTSIESGAFRDCTGLTEITIPNSVTSIGSDAFRDCTAIVEITIPNSVTSIGGGAFDGCTGLTEINIPNSVTSIGGDAFHGCTGLTEINIPNSVTNIGSTAFDGCKGLEAINVADENTKYSSLDGILYNKDKSSLLRCPEGKQISSFVIPSSVTSVGSTAFDGCKGLEAINVADENTKYSSLDGILYNKDKSSLLRYPEGKQISSFVIPSSVTSIGGDAFWGCTGLTEINIPNSVTSIGWYAFYGCNNLQDLYILSSTVSLGRSLGTCNTVYAYKNVLNMLYDADLHYKRKIEICNSYYMLSDIQHLSPSTITFLVKELPSKGSIGTLVRVECDGKVLSPNASGIYTLTDLIVEKNYTISLVVDVNGTEETYQQIINNPKPQFELSVKESQTNFNISVSSKIIYTDSNAKEIGVKCDGKDYSVVPGKVYINGIACFYGKITIPELVPDQRYYIYPYIIYDDNTRIEGDHNSYSTKGVSPKIKGSFNGPTAYKAHGSYYLGTATLKDAALYFDGKKYEGNDIYVTGLNPDTKYTVEYVVTTNEGSTETDRQTITTPALELTTLQPKGVSERCSIVAATTNICDDEPNVGFQWKKYDAPESLKPSEGYAAIYDGQLEGYIKNLQPTSYYKVRAFYKSATDKYYYGDWVTFDPSDFSYFEPTVHTYEATDVTSTSAKVKGYVLAGTENIIEQGFEYWPVNISQSKAMRVVAAENNVSTIFCTGQVMTATLTDLQPNTTYRFRSFVKTASGMTYGEEQMLTTAYDPTGIGGVETSSSETTVIGYYDINGRKLDGIGNGITIVRYSNGSVRKVVRK